MNWKSVEWIGKIRLHSLIDQEEKGMQILCLGPEGTYGHQVAHQINKRYFGEQGGIVFRKSHEEILAQLDRAKDSHTVGVVAVRNSIAGLVMEVVRYRLSPLPSSLRIIGEVDLPIHHQLLARPGVPLREVQSVFSHPQGLVQCEQTLNALGIVERKPVVSTAGAAKIVADHDGKEAAISSRFCAELYGLEILQQNLEDVPGNTTRFHIVANMPGVLPAWKYDSDNRKMAVVWTVKNEVGALYRVLREIYEAGLNMEFIASVQFGGMNNVAFYVEMDAPQEEEEQERISQAISCVAETIVCLGVFPKGITIEE